MNRNYKAVMVHGATISAVSFTAMGILNNEDRNRFEWVYAIQEIFEEIIDLKPNESMYFQPNRDDKTTKGIIIRVS